MFNLLEYVSKCLSRKHAREESALPGDQDLMHIFVDVESKLCEDLHVNWVGQQPAAPSARAAGGWDGGHLVFFVCAMGPRSYRCHITRQARIMKTPAVEPES